jgi:hypothetical protein
MWNVEYVWPWKLPKEVVQAVVFATTAKYPILSPLPRPMAMN